MSIKLVKPLLQSGVLMFFILLANAMALFVTVSFNFLSWLYMYVINATFDNISVMSWRSVLNDGGNRRKPPTCHK